jgi:hypothetical protein
MTPLCRACFGLGNAQVDVALTLALLDAGANVDFASHTRIDQPEVPGCTPLMFAAIGNRACVVKLLITRGADGSMTTTETAGRIDAGSTALDIARILAEESAEFAETFAVLRLMCCSTCGRGSRTFTFQLNLSRVRHTRTPYTP